MDMRTHYLGIELPHPFMPGAGPMSQNLDAIKRLEDAGAAAIVMNSLFEEQLTAEQVTGHAAMDGHGESYAEALDYLPSPDEYALGPQEYLDHLRTVKESVGIPVIGSLNGTTPGGWLRYARLIEQAGADALELNVYEVATDADVSGGELEQRVVDMVSTIKQSIRIPLAVKLSPFYTSLPHFAWRLERAGADGLVIFNRFYQPNIDVEELEVLPYVTLSTSDELLLRLRWLSILSARLQASLAVTGGVHTAVDAIRAILCGASAVQAVAAILRCGPDWLKTVREEVQRWLEAHEYQSLRQMVGSMSLVHCPDPKALVRANYMQVLQSWTI